MHANVGLFGGEGNDRFIIAGLSDLQTLNGGAGNDTLITDTTTLTDNTIEWIEFR